MQLGRQRLALPYDVPTQPRRASCSRSSTASNPRRLRRRHRLDHLVESERGDVGHRHRPNLKGTSPGRRAATRARGRRADFATAADFVRSERAAAAGVPLGRGHRNAPERLVRRDRILRRAGDDDRVALRLDVADSVHDDRGRQRDCDRERNRDRDETDEQLRQLPAATRLAACQRAGRADGAPRAPRAAVVLPQRATRDTAAQPCSRGTGTQRSPGCVNAGSALPPTRFHVFATNCMPPK